MGIKIEGKCIDLVTAQVIIEAYNRKMNGNTLPPLYIYTHISVRACERAGVRACERGQK